MCMQKTFLQLAPVMGNVNSDSHLMAWELNVLLRAQLASAVSRYYALKDMGYDTCSVYKVRIWRRCQLQTTKQLLILTKKQKCSKVHKLSHICINITLQTNIHKNSNRLFKLNDQGIINKYKLYFNCFHMFHTWMIQIIKQIVIIF